MTRDDLKQLLSDHNAMGVAAKIIGHPTQHIESEAVAERLRNEASKLIVVADRIDRAVERVNARKI